MLLFRSEEHLDRWVAQGFPKGASFTVPQCWELAKAWYSDRLDPEWTRNTPETAHQIFERIGLTGRFWSPYR